MQAIDAWVNVEMPAWPAAWQQQAARQLGRAPSEVFRDIPVDELLADMDLAGVGRAVLTLQAERPAKKVLRFAEQHPERFVYSALVDPRGGMKALRALEKLVRQQPVKLARVIPGLLNLPPDDRVYYPLYAKCIELGLPISINTGIPGPPLPGRCQDPMHLDDVCLFFPELVLIMGHGADPWWDVAIRLMLKYPNLHLMTSACAPRYLPAALLHFMNTRGRSQVLFGTDYPFLTMQRCLREAEALSWRDSEARHAYLWANAARLFWGETIETA